MTNGPVVFISDDEDDKEFLKDAWKELKYENPLLFFKSGEEIIDYLHSNKETPFIILCDANLPKMDGFELKKKIQKDYSSNYKSIPFIFWSSDISKTQLKKAYDLGVNGVFAQEVNFKGLKESLNDIVRYWKRSQMPE